MVAAVVVLRPGEIADDEGLRGFVAARLARHKVPRHWRIVEELPVNASGKIQKFVLRDQFQTST